MTDEYLGLAMLIMGIAIGVLLVIWGAMSLYFAIRNKKRAKRTMEKMKAQEAAEAAYRAEREREEAAEAESETKEQ